MEPSSQSFIASLEPLLGGGLALNLAYLYLQWFYYLQRIGEAAVDARKAGADSNVILSKSDGNRNVRCVDYLVSLGLAGENGEKPVRRALCLPVEKVWTYFLVVFFVTKLDRGVAIAGTALIILFLIIGTGHQTGVYSSYLANPSENAQHWIFHIVTLIFVWPVFMAVTAHVVRSSVTGFVKETVGGAAMEMKTSARTAVGSAPPAQQMQGPQQPTS